jgi:GT2 family glycosyltransferase
VVTAGREPTLSVIMPTYESHVTLAGTLDALRMQTMQNFEIIVVDSSPSERVAEVIASYPEVRFHRSRERLLPHAARNRGAALARAPWLVHTDPDVYPEPRWLDRLWDAHVASEVVIGAVACYGRIWLDLGVHLAKYHSWLPGGPRRSTYGVQSANLMCSRRVWDAIGGLPEDSFIGDATLGWWLETRGEPAVFAPDAVVQHHHLIDARSFFAERVLRGEEIATRKTAYAHMTTGTLAARLVLTLVGARALRIVAMRVARAVRAGWTRTAILTLPIWLGGELAWEVGEARGYFRMLRAAR